MILVILGAEYPNQLLTVVLRGKAKSLAPEMDGKTIWLTGRIIDYKGKPEIEITDKTQISFQLVVGGSGKNGG